MRKLAVGAVLAAVLAGCASPKVAADAAALPLRAETLRTPDERFANLQGWSFKPHYADIADYRMHYVDEGPGNAAPVLMLHGEPTWSYLYRKMIPPVAGAGHRVIAPDLIGFGRSDKPAAMDAHSYKFHVDAISELIRELDLRNITLVCQDWGSLIGLRVAAENPDRFTRIVLANGALPEGASMGPGFEGWNRMAAGFRAPGDMPVGQMVGRQHGPDVVAGYDAPFPDKSYKAGPLIMPALVPVTPEDPAVTANQRAWEVFKTWRKPFLTAFSDGDPVTRGQDKKFLDLVPGAKDQKHITIKGAGHFLQEDKGDELAAVVIQFIKDNP